MASKRGGPSGKGKGKRRRFSGEMDDERDDGHPYCSICSASAPGEIIRCAFCKASCHGWCVSLRDRDFLPEGGHAWFEKYACPGCVEKGERSTRSSGSKRLSSSDTGEYSDLHASAKALWDLVLTTSISSTETAEWTCRMVINTVENQDEGRLESERRLLELLDLIVGTLHYLMIPMGESQMQKLFDFHTKFALRFLKASPPHMREWGWNQMDGLLSLTQRHCWSPRAVRVQGAGSPELDGVYRVSRNDATGLREKAYFVSAKTLASSMPPQNRTPPRYIHEGGTNELSLSQNCEGRSLWYISRLVPSTPCHRATTKACYSFQAPSPAENLVRPCGSGWEKADEHEDLDPPPVVTAETSEGYLCPEGKGKNTREWELAEWIIRNKVVDKIFEEPTSPAVVKGSIELLRFMARMEATLTPDHISLIWRSAVKMGPEFQIVANNMLVRLAPDVKPELMVHLFERLQEGVGGSREWGEWRDVLMFLAFLANNPGHRTLGIFGKVRAATASLVWSLLEKPEVLRHEFCKPVSTLLTSVVYTPKETMNNQNNFQQFLERCIGSWQTSSESPGSVSTVRYMLDNFELKHIRQLAHLFDTGHYVLTANSEWSNDGAGEGQAKPKENQSGQTSLLGCIKAEETAAARFPETLRQEKCDICQLPDLLDNAGTDMFGVVSWRCRCPTRRKAHSRCIFAHNEKHRRTQCPHCRKDMSFGKNMETGRQWSSLELHNPPNDAVLTDGDYESDDYDSPSDVVDDHRNDPTFRGR